MARSPSLNPGTPVAGDLRICIPHFPSPAMIKMVLWHHLTRQGLHVGHLVGGCAFSRPSAWMENEPGRQLGYHCGQTCDQMMAQRAVGRKLEDPAVLSESNCATVTVILTPPGSDMSGLNPKPQPWHTCCWRPKDLYPHFPSPAMILTGFVESFDQARAACRASCGWLCIL